MIERFALRSGRRLGILARVPTARSNAGAVDVSEPHLTRAGSYVITLAHDVTCKPIASSECIPLGPNTCGSRIESLNPASRRYTTLFTEPRDVRVFDAVPGPDGRSFALLERGCSTDTFTIVVRSGPRGRELTLGRCNPACGEAPTVAWSADGSQLVFVDELAPPSAGGAPDCSLAIASTRASTPYRFVAPDAGCAFRSAAFDRDGIAAIESCRAKQTAETTRLLQLNQRRRVIGRINLPSGPAGVDNSGEALVVDDPQADIVLVSEDLPGHPQSTRIWAFDGSHLHLIRRYTNNPLLAEP